MSVTQAFLGPLLADSSARPLMTHYDDASGGRVELSRATLANWAAKTANWLVEEADLEPGMPVSVSLPAHWQTAGILLGAWWCGAHVTDDPSGAEAAFVPAAQPSAGDGARTVVGVGLDPLGGPSTGLPQGTVDYATEVRTYGDEFIPLAPVPGTSPALLGTSVDDLVSTARRRAEELAIGKDDRVLSTLSWDLPDGVVDGLLAVLAARGSLVQCTNHDPALLDKRRSDERATRELGTGR